MELGNILNNRVVAAPSFREVSGWRVPVSTPSEVSFALKCAKASTPSSLSDRVQALAAIGREASWISEDELREIVAKTGTTLRFLRISLGRINGWLAKIDRYLESQGTLVGGALHRDGMMWTGGLPTAMILAGDATSLAPYALGHLVLAGARGVVKPSNAEALSPFLFLRALIDKGVTVPSMIYLDSSAEVDREAIRQLISRTSQSVVFGEDRTVASIYGPLPFNPAHKPIPYWSGRSGVVVLADADVEVAARCIVYGAAEDRGNRCICTKKVIAPASIAARLEEALFRAADQLRRGDPLNEGTEIGVLEAGARSEAQRFIGESQVLYDRELVICRCQSYDKLLQEEPPYPIIGIRYCEEGEDPIEVANALVEGTPAGRALSTSVITSSRAAFDLAAERLASCKVLHNRPTTDMDQMTMHQAMHLFLELMRPKAVIL